jgi:transmembrane sensor
VTNSAPTVSDIARLRDASEWVQRLNESNVEAVADQWMQWCKSDPLNLPAFEQMQRLWNAFPKASETVFQPRQPANRLRHRSRLVALAASVLLLVGVAAWFALRYPEIRVLNTPVGEQRRIDLADGSHLDLAPNSRVSTRFTLTRRDVKLERGQAFFEVAHNALRPFIVHVNGLTVTAVGTAFDVRIGPSNTVVTVSEGRVNVAPGADEVGRGSHPQPEIVRAGAGQRVTFSKSAQRLTVADIDPKAAASWRGGTLQFVSEPLADVVGAINRYSASQIIVAPAFQQTRFTGTVSPVNVRDWLKALEQIYAIEVVDQGANGVLIRSRAGDGARK